MDSEYLVVWHGWDGSPWRYLSQPDLCEFLLERIADGFAFPLNPKWVLIDAGRWRDVFAALCASEAASEPLRTWWPPGLLQTLQELCELHPHGFQRASDEQCDLHEGAEGDTRSMADMAEFELRRHVHEHIRNVRAKLRAVGFLMRKMPRASQRASAIYGASRLSTTSASPSDTSRISQAFV